MVSHARFVITLLGEPDFQVACGRQVQMTECVLRGWRLPDGSVDVAGSQWPRRQWPAETSERQLWSTTAH